MSDVAIVLILVAAAVAVSVVLRLGLEKDLAIAAVRALGQIALVAALITLIFENPPYSAAFLLVMLAVAAWTSGRRLKGVPGAVRVSALAIGSGSALALIVLFGLGVFEIEPRFLLPIAGMLIGNSMNATSVAGALLRDEIAYKRLEIESRIALGVRARYALRSYVRKALTTSLVPLIDATKNAGVILLPGAFVGMIIGGASPAEAARVQIIVLFMLLGAVSVAGMVAAALVARSFIAPGERIRPPEGVTT